MRTFKLTLTVEPKVIIKMMMMLILPCLIMACILFQFYIPMVYGESDKTIAVEEYSIIEPMAIKSLLLDLACIGDNYLITVGERGHILYSENSGQNWHQAQVPTRSTLNAVFFIDEHHGWTVGHDAVILFTDDKGKSWKRQYFAPDKEQPLFDVWFKDTMFGIAVGAYGIYLETEDGGKTWNEKYYDVLDDPEFGLPHFNAIALAPNQSLYMVGEAGFIAVSKDYGKTWEQLERPYIGSYFNLIITQKGTLLAVGLRGNIYRSDNEGESWDHIETNNRSSINHGIQFSNGNIMLVGMDGIILRSSDDGKSFSVSRRKDRMAISAVTEIVTRKLFISGEEGIREIDSQGQDKETKK